LKLTPEESINFIADLVIRFREEGETNNQVLVRIITTLVALVETMWKNLDVDYDNDKTRDILKKFMQTYNEKTWKEERRK